jgi:radical SAM superfamily enzyme YgiQ (UPF0313 family)
MELERLKTLKLHTVYTGLESGSSAVLQEMCKQEQPEEIADAVRRAQGVGLRASVMILLGLGGRRLQETHIRDTAAVLSRMQPRLLSALRVVPVPDTPLTRDVDAGRFEVLSEYEVVEELLLLVERLGLDGTVFRADHSSNVIPVQGRLPKDRPRLLRELRQLLASGMLDKKTSGPLPLWL